MKYKKVELHTTYGSGKWNEQFYQAVGFTSGETEDKVVNLYPEVKGQKLDGFGGAVTESAAYIYSLMNQAQKDAMMHTYFSPEEMNYQMIRVPIDSCDFSLGQWEVSSKADFSDWDFSRVEQYIIPMLKDAEKAAGHKIPLMVAPWSMPAYMKTNGKRDHGGRLKEQYKGLWAEYICRYIGELEKRGFQVKCLSVQNEPKAVQTWDSCVYTAAEEKAFIRDFMVPALKKHGYEDMEIYIWDHNKERVYEWMKEICDEEVGPMITGAAFHWYSGDHFELLDLCRVQFPDKKLVLSESCIEFSKYDPEDHFGAAKTFSHEMMGDLNHGISFFGDWNLVLDENGGPNYVGNNCLAPFIFDTRTKELKPQLLQQYMASFSKTLTPGSVRIGSSTYSELVEATAWLRPDESIGVVLLNKAKEISQVCIRLEGKEAHLLLYPESITSCVIR